MDLRIKFLGTSNSIPTKERNHTAILVDVSNEHILVDCGEGTQRQFRLADENPCKLTKMLITHWHGDHVLGIPGLLQTLEMSGYPKKLEIYGPKWSKEKFSSIKKIYGKRSIKHEITEVSRKVFENKDIEINAFPAIHGIPTNTYSISIKDKIRLDKKKLKKLKLPNSPIIGKLKEGKDIIVNDKKISAKSVSYTKKGKKIAIILDTGYSLSLINIAKNSDILICEASYSESEKEKAKEFRHLTAKQAAAIARKAKVKQLILTHISQRYEKNISELEKEAKKIFKNTKIANDFDEIII